MLNATGLKAYGLLVGDLRDPAFPYRAVDVVVLDPHQNRRNEPGHRAAFHAQGSYFRAYEDAGFVADPIDLLRAWRRIEGAGLEPVAAFHVHRRQPANFSSIDYRLHNPAFAWHLIISLRDPAIPDVRPFLVRKDPEHYGPLFPGVPADLEYVWPTRREQPDPTPQRAGHARAERAQTTE